MGFFSKKHRDIFEDNKPDELKADIYCFSGCEDDQTSADVSDVNSFCLPDPAGRAGGACTSMLLKVVYEDEKTPEDTYTFVEVIDKMRDNLEAGGYTQIPQFTSSKPINVNSKFDLVPDTHTGTRRALFFGLNYVGHEVGELSGCHNDVLNMKKYIQDIHGFEEENIKVYMDDGEHEMPTYENIVAAFKQIVAEAEPGDALYIHYSGHGASIPDDNGDEEDGKDESLVPVDYPENGLIRDDDLYEIVVKGLPEGVFLFALMDCCHSGTVFDLPYELKPGQTEMNIPEKWKAGKFMRKFGGKLAGLFG